MATICGCGMAVGPRSGPARCDECGTACCRSCAVEIAARLYCRWCAPLAAAA